MWSIVGGVHSRKKKQKPWHLLCVSGRVIALQVDQPELLLPRNVHSTWWDKYTNTWGETNEIITREEPRVCRGGRGCTPLRHSEGAPKRYSDIIKCQDHSVRRTIRDIRGIYWQLALKSYCFGLNARGMTDPSPSWALLIKWGLLYLPPKVVERIMYGPCFVQFLAPN